MGIFKRKQKKEELDPRSDLEKKFEDVGQVAGQKTGKFVQGSIDKFEEVKIKVKADEKIEKVKEFALKAEDKIDDIVGKATKASKEKLNKMKNKEKV